MSVVPPPVSTLNTLRSTKYTIANQACDHTKTVLSLGPTNDVVGAVADTLSELVLREPSEARKKLNEARSKYPNHVPGAAGGYRMSISVFPQLVTLIKEARTGCCGEFALVAFEYLRGRTSNGTIFPIEFVHATNHWIIVVNRDKSTNITDPTTWGSETYVCDPWNSKVWTYNDFGKPGWRYTPTGKITLRLPGDASQGFLVTNWNAW